jgi:hypothetical protein
MPDPLLYGAVHGVHDRVEVVPRPGRRLNLGVGDQTRVVHVDQATEDPTALLMIAPGHKFPVPIGVSKKNC